MLTTILSFAFVLGILIFVHELGHFLTAKMVGIRVERFSLGFPPRMIGKQIGETDYCVSWLPLGGYVKMAGMIDESLDDTIKGEPWEYQSKPVWQRIIVISAGSLMNILTAVLIFAAVAFFKGYDVPKGALIKDVLEGKPAASIGLQDGDTIISINNESVMSAMDLIRIVSVSADTELEIEWTRDGQTMQATVIPELDEEKQIGLIGVQVNTLTEKVQTGFTGSLEYGYSTSYQILRDVTHHLGQIITGKQSLKESVGGPITIMALAGESAKHGFERLLELTAFISINLGFFNMLPFPVLDGGHLVMLLIEGVIRKPLPVKARVTIQKIGMAFLLALMIFIIFNDITRLKELPF